MKSFLVLLHFALASEIRSRKQGNDPYLSVAWNPPPVKDTLIHESSSRQSLSDSQDSDDQSSSPSASISSEPSEYEDTIVRPSSKVSTELSPKAVLNRVKWHGGLVTASQAIVLPITTFLLTSSPDHFKFILGIVVYTLGLLVEKHSIKNFAIVPKTQPQFLNVKLLMMIFSVVAASQVQLESIGQLACGVNVWLVLLSMMTLLLPYIRLHDIKDL